MGNGADKMDDEERIRIVLKCEFCNNEYDTEKIEILNDKWSCPNCYCPNYLNKKSSALNKQIGGDHYKCFEVQPAYYYTKNKFGGLQSSIIKRISRYNQPTGKGLQDLEKIKHEIDLIIELEGWRNK